MPFFGGFRRKSIIRRSIQTTWFAIAIVVLVLAGFLGKMFWESYQSRQQYRQLLAEMDRQQPGWRWQSMVEAMPNLPPENNNLLIMLEAEERKNNYQQFTIYSGRYYSDILRSYHVHRSQEEIKILEEFLTGNESSFHLLRRLHEFPDGQMQAKANMLPKGTSDDTYLNSILTCANFLRLEFEYRCHLGQKSAALNVLRSMVNCTDSINFSTGLRGHIIRCNVLINLCWSAERLLGLFELTESELVQLSQILTDIEFTKRFQESCAGERAQIAFLCEQLSSGELSLKEYLREYFSYTMTPPEYQYWLNYSHNWSEEILNLLRHANRIVEASQMTPETMLGFLQHISRPPYIQEDKKHHQLLSRLHQTDRIGFDIYLRGLAKLGSLQGAIQLERYRLQHGYWPADQVELERFSGALPADPYNSESLKMHHFSGAVSIYSVGINLRDDFGWVHPRKVFFTTSGRPGERNSSGDIGTLLWHPERRGLPPMKAELNPPKITNNVIQRNALIPYESPGIELPASLELAETGPAPREVLVAPESQPIPVGGR
ncbi:MAG: hypothetical protein R3B84_23265 [Zavarzinella sp.]